MNTLTGLTPAPANPPPFTININGTADVVASLPQGAAAKVRTLRRRVSDLHLLLPEQSERQQANEAKFMAEQRLKRLQDHPHDGGFGLDNEDRRVADERRNVARLATEARSITERYEMRAAAWQKAGACLWHIENWLADGGRRAGMMLDDFDAPPPKLGKGRKSARCHRPSP